MSSVIKWREMGTMLYDPMWNEGVNDSELYFAIVFKALNLNDMNLAASILAARNFGLRIEASPKYGYRIVSISEEYKPYFTKCFNASKDNLLKILKELAEECPP